MGLPAFKLTTFQTPIAQWAYLRERVEALAPLMASIDATIITPLKSAADEVEWADRMDELLPIWMGMRLFRRTLDEVLTVTPVAAA